MRLKVLSSYESIDDTGEVFDVGLQVGRMAERRFNTEPIADDAIFPVCSPAFASSMKIGESPISELPLLHLENQGRGWPDWAEYLAYLGEQAPPSKPGLVFTTYDVCLEMASLGEGVALGWARSVKSKIDEGKLVRLEAPIMPLPDCVHIYLPLLSAPSKEVNSFIKLLKNSIQPIEY